MNDELRKAIDAALDEAMADRAAGTLSEEDSEELEQYVLEYERNTDEADQSVEDFEEYLDSFWRNR